MALDDAARPREDGKEFTVIAEQVKLLVCRVSALWVAPTSDCTSRVRICGVCRKCSLVLRLVCGHA
jgi:hypothetical protein